MSRKAKLEKYRDLISDVTSSNINTVLSSPHWTPEEKAGTLVLMAASILSHAAFAVGKIDERLKNAPPEAQLDDMLTLLRGILVTDRPVSTSMQNGKGRLHVVATSTPNSKEGA